MGLSKYEKESILRTSNADNEWHIYTHSTKLKQRLANMANLYPNHFKFIEKNAHGGVTYLVAKACFILRFVRPTGKH